MERLTMYFLQFILGAAVCFLSCVWYMIANELSTGENLLFLVLIAFGVAILIYAPQPKNEAKMRWKSVAGVMIWPSVFSLCLLAFSLLPPLATVINQLGTIKTVLAMSAIAAILHAIYIVKAKLIPYYGDFLKELMVRLKKPYFSI